MKNRLLLLFTLVAAWGVPVPLSAQTYNCYFGDIHTQTWYSDGNQDQNQATYTVPVARAITYARDVANDMDFLGISDHNHNESLNMTLAYWNAGNNEADSMNQDGVFVGLRGQEWGTISGGGHVLVYGTSKLFGWNPGVYDVYVPKSNYTLLFDSVKKYNGYCYLAHPNSSDYSNLINIAYNASWDSVIEGVSMKNGPALTAGYTESNPSSTTYESYYHSLLKVGYHVAPVANQDNHHTNFGMLNQQRTVVLAPSLTRANVNDALKNRRVYATEDHNLQVRLEVGSHQMGEIFTHSGAIPFRVKATDPDGTNLISSIQLRYGVPGSGAVPTTLSTVSNIDSLILSHSQSIGTTYYYYALVTETSGRRAWTAPVWITISAGSPPGAFNLLTPSNAASDQPVAGTLSWAASSGATQYDVYLGTSNPPTTLVSSDQAGTSYSYAGLANSTTYYWKVVAENGSGTTDATGSPRSFSTIVALPGTFNQTSPTNGAVDQAIAGSLTWQASANAATYDVYLDTNSSPTTIVSTNQAGTSYSYGGLLNSKLYYWKIVAKNVAGSTTATGAPWNLTTIVAAPGAFSHLSPSHGAVNQPVSGTLSWQASSNAANYDVYIDTNSNPTTIVSVNQAGTSYPYSGLLNSKTYYWKVVAKNAAGNITASGTPWSLTTIILPPGSFAQTSPANGAINQLIAGTLTWQAAPNAANYDVYLDTNSNPTTIVSANQAGTSYSYSGLLNSKTHFWKIVAKNVGGNVTATGAPWNFTTIMAAPGPFNQLTPSNSATNQPISGTLTWQSSPNAASYDVYLDTSTDPATIVSGNQAGTAYSYSGLLNNTLYRWKIVAKNIGGNTIATGTPWSFTTIVVVPGSFAQLSPPDGSTNQPTVGTLSWQASPNAASYDVVLDTVNPPTTIVSADQAATTYNYSGLQIGKPYYWKVIAKNVAGTLAGSGSPWNFATLVAAPEAFVQLSPANGTVFQPQAGTLSWQASVNATAYDVYLGTDNPPTTLVSSNQSGLSYAYSGLSNGITYFWKVIARNSSGTIDATGSPWNFNVAVLPPGAFALLTPAQSAVEQPISGPLLWGTSAHAEVYDIYLDVENPPTTLFDSDLPDTSISYLGLAAGATYYWKVVARNASGEMTSTGAPSSFTIMNLPPSASNQISAPITTTSMQVSWKDNATNETGYKIYRSQNPGGPFLQSGGSLPANTISYTDTGLNINERYYFRIAPFNALGEGTFVLTSAATFALQPGAPTVVSLSYSSMMVTLDLGPNPITTQFAVRITTAGLDRFLQSDGSLGNTPAWNTFSGWGGIGGTVTVGLTSCQEYVVDVKAKNLEMVETSYGPNTAVTVECFSVSRNIETGWNLVSIPLEVSNAHSASVFPSSNSSTFAYQGGYIASDTMELGRGYWLKFPSAGPVGLAGQPKLDGSIAIQSGWNVIGSISIPLSVIGVQEIPAGIITSPYYAYQGGYLATDSIIPMHAYWVKANNPGVLVLSSAAIPQRSPLTTLANETRRGKLLFTNADHRTYILYLLSSAGRAEGDPGTLPPKPPSDAYDVRFRGDRSVVDLPAVGDTEVSEYEIELQSAGRAIGVSWELDQSEPYTYSLLVDGTSYSLVEKNSLVIPPTVRTLKLTVQPRGKKVPAEFTLRQNYPNPFNPSTEIKFDVPVMSDVELVVFNLLGVPVARLVNGIQDAGHHSVTWVPQGATGMYIYRLEARSIDDPAVVYRQVRSMVYLK